MDPCNGSMQWIMDPCDDSMRWIDAMDQLMRWIDRFDRCSAIESALSFLVNGCVWVLECRLRSAYFLWHSKYYLKCSMAVVGDWGALIFCAFPLTAPLFYQPLRLVSCCASLLVDRSVSCCASLVDQSRCGSMCCALVCDSGIWSCNVLAMSQG